MEFFAARNAEISIVEMMDQIGRDLDPVTKNDMKDQMKKHHVAQLTKTALQEVKDSSFLVKDAVCFNTLKQMVEKQQRMIKKFSAVFVMLETGRYF